YAPRFTGLDQVGPPVSRGHYVIYLRPEDRALRDALDRGLGRLIASGDLRRLYEHYGIWTDAPEELKQIAGRIEPTSEVRKVGGWVLLQGSWRPLMAATFMTFALSVTSMPIAMAIGLIVALGRLYGPRSLNLLLTGYVELLRGTPLMLQLFVLFYLLRL